VKVPRLWRWWSAVPPPLSSSASLSVLSRGCGLDPNPGAEQG
jgi:hypothetical protein